MTRPPALTRADRQRQDKPDDGILAVAMALARLHARRDHAAELKRIEADDADRKAG